MYKILIILILLILTVYIVPLRYKFITKNKKHIYVSSLGNAYEWNKKFFDVYLRKKYPGKKIIYKNISNPDLLLVSPFPSFEDKILYITPETQVITWSGEPETVKGYPKAIQNFISQSPRKKEDIWLPYLVVAHYQMNKGIDKIINKNFKPIEERENFVAYIASNCVNEREELFKELLKKNLPGTHALGRCSNNVKKIDGDFTVLDNIYENYIFGFAMENCILEGYITEKILNIYNSGAIPIYRGDDKAVDKFFNKGTYININDFASLKEAADYLYDLSLNKEALKKIKQIDVFKNVEVFENIDFDIKY